MADELNLKGLTLLVADSNDAFRSIVKGVLNRFGAQAVIEAKTGEQMLHELKGRQVDALLCDLMLDGGSNGAQLIQRLRHDPESQHRYIPMIVLTGHTQKKHVEICRDCGANIVIAKPVSPRTLYDRLAWIANNHRAFVQAPTYCGPDRRFRELGPPNGLGRRSEDLDKRSDG